MLSDLSHLWFGATLKSVSIMPITTNLTLFRWTIVLLPVVGFAALDPVSMSDTQLIAGHALCDRASFCFVIRHACRRISHQVLFEG
jgi:hypothetical protein